MFIYFFKVTGIHNFARNVEKAQDVSRGIKAPASLAFLWWLAREWMTSEVGGYVFIKQKAGIKSW